MTYPSNTNPDPQAGPGAEPAYPYPYPPQGYPPSQPAYPPPSQPLYPPQQPSQGYPPQYGYPQPSYPQPQYPQAPYPQQFQGQGYPQPQQPYGQYGQYGAPQPGYPYPAAPAKATNRMAQTALIYGALIFVVNFIGLFIGFYFIGFTAIYAIIYGVRALNYGAKLPGKPGTAMAIIGMVLAALALCITVLGLAGA